MHNDLHNKRICVSGGAGFLGRAVCARLRGAGVENVVVPRSCDYDFTRADHVERFFDDASPQIVIHLAAEVGGIGANEANPGRYFYANMAMGLHLIEESRRRGVERFVQVGTVCSYPKFCAVPFCEGDLWGGYPEETNAPYGVAKRALGVMLDAYRRQYGFNGVYLIPVNLYGPGDNFDPRTSHVVPAMIRRFCEAIEEGRDQVTCWGTGNASRELLYVDDAAEAIVQAAAEHNDSAPINLGTGREITIARLAEMIADICGYRGRVAWDASRTDGQPRRCLDTSRAERLLSWRATTTLEGGLRRTIEWWRSQEPADRELQVSHRP
ncbi:MAG: GDP-L-fucose synthase [Phycisphaerales bacterium]|nr:GDP-L-fucose synthase [Phycisphaerales bacterium]